MWGEVAECGRNHGERTDRTENRGHTFRVVFVFTCFTMMSARDLSNCRTATRWRHIVSRVGRSASLKVDWNHTHLLQDLHRQLWGYRTARDELVKRVGERHADPRRVGAGLSQSNSRAG